MNKGLASCFALLAAFCACREEPHTMRSTAPPRAPETAAHNAAGAVTPKVGTALPTPASSSTAAPCEAAYVSWKAFDAEMRKSGGKTPSRAFPSRAKFLAACGAFPAAAQPCVDLDYAFSHAEECKAATAAVDPKTKADFEVAMGAPRK